ncbi:hypothetical protein ACKLNO_01880 [Neisseriaceae bacterium B1]
MKKLLLCGLSAFILSACASNSSTGNTEMYGQIKGGIKHSHTF